MAETKKTYREVPEEIRQALANHLIGLDFSNLFIEEDPTDKVHKLGKIVNRTEKNSEGNEPQLTPDGAWIHAVVCSVHWLAREDAGVIGGHFMDGMYTEEQLALPKNVTLINDALTLDHLSHLRDETNRKNELGKYRDHTIALNRMLFNAAVADLPMYRSEISNALITEMGAKKYVVPKLAKDVVLISILRAGESMAFTGMEILPESALGHAGIVRDKHAIPHEYKWIMPPTSENSVLVILDPMLATGGSVLDVLDKIVEKGMKYKEIRLVFQVAAPEGIERVLEKYPNVKIFLAAVDSHLNDLGYIEPGLGDAGDNFFGTEPEEGHSIT